MYNTNTPWHINVTGKGKKKKYTVVFIEGYVARAVIMEDGRLYDIAVIKKDLNSKEEAKNYKIINILRREHLFATKERAQHEIMRLERFNN